jgi:hypothetical protein
MNIHHANKYTSSSIISFVRNNKIISGLYDTDWWEIKFLSFSKNWGQIIWNVMRPLRRDWNLSQNNHSQKSNLWPHIYSVLWLLSLMIACTVCFKFERKYMVQHISSPAQYDALALCSFGLFCCPYIYIFWILCWS